MTDCKLCTSGTNCQECGRPSKGASPITIYLHHNKSPISCKDTCDKSLNEHVVTKATFPTCHQCPDGEFYMDGSFPPLCTPCNFPSYWKDVENNLCRKCAEGCISCNSRDTCNSCSNTDDFVQTSGGGCETNCKQREMKNSELNPKRCQPCSENCMECNFVLGCRKCDPGYYKDTGLKATCHRCPDGCSDCSSNKKCSGCTNPAHFLGIDETSCSDNCRDKEYKEETTKRCRACHDTNCLKCDKTGKCKQCPNIGFYLDSGSCQSCPTGCKTCLNSKKCLSCSDPAHFLGMDKLTCSENCEKRRFKEVESKQCKECPPLCVSCRDDKTCEKCEEGSFIKLDNSCQRCPLQCSSCTSTTNCLSCKDPTHFLSLDRISCSETCPKGSRKNELTRIKTCIACLKDCELCNQKECKKCMPGKILKNRVCTSCTEDCKLCGDQGCEECFPGKGLVNGNCVACSQDCLKCNSEGCLVCDTGKALDNEKTCHKGFVVDYSLRQFYDPKSNQTFSLRLILQEYPKISQILYREFQNQLHNSEDKFKLTPLKDAGMASIEINKHSDRVNELIIGINLTEKEGIEIGQKVEILVESYNKELASSKKEPKSVYLLAKKTQIVELEVYKLSPRLLGNAARSMATISSSANSFSSSSSMGLGAILGMFSGDPDGSFLKFNQFLTFLRRLKLIGIYFGDSLQDFIELVAGERPSLESSHSSKNRSLELSLRENQKDKIREYSAGWHSKLDTYQETVFFEGPYMLKTVVYLFSWLLKLLGITLLKGMKSTQRVVIWKLKFLKYQRRVHFAVFMGATMDILFYGVRIVLHRRYSFWGFNVKLVSGVAVGLVTWDMLELLWVALGVEYEAGNGNRKKSPLENPERLERAKVHPLNHELSNAPPFTPRSRARKERGKKPMSDSKLNILDDNSYQKQENPQQSKAIGQKYNPPKKKRSEAVQAVRDKPKTASKEPQVQKIKLTRQKLFIDHPRTITYNSRNLPLEEFSSTYLRNNRTSFSSPLYKASNFLNIIHLSVIQVSIVSLCNSSVSLLVVLVTSELVLLLLTVLPYFKHRYITLVEFLDRATRSICLGGFYFICLAIRLRLGAERRPVSDELQNWGIRFVSLGIISTYFFSSIKGTIVLFALLKELWNNKGCSREDSNEEDLSVSKRGLIIYSETDSSSLVRCHPLDGEIVIGEDSKKRVGKKESILRSGLSSSANNNRFFMGSRKREIAYDLEYKSSQNSPKGHLGCRTDGMPHKNSWESIFHGLERKMNKKRSKPKKGSSSRRAERGPQFDSHLRVNNKVKQKPLSQKWNSGLSNSLAVDYSKNSIEINWKGGKKRTFNYI